MQDYVTCRRCGGNYDYGELRGGICDDCRAAAEKAEAAGRGKAAERCTKEQADGQMVLMPAMLIR